MKQKCFRQLLSFILAVTMLFGIMPGSLTVYAADSNATVVTTAEEFVSAIKNGDGSITLGNDIAIDISTVGCLKIANNITLDCNGYKLSAGGAVYTNESTDYGLFVVESGYTFTLVNAQIAMTGCTYSDGNKGLDDFIEENNGTVIIESTAGGGISSENFVSTNNGEVIVKSTSDNGISATDDFIDTNNGALKIYGGTFNVGSCVVDGSEGSVEVTAGKFIAGGYCFDDISGTLKISNATIISDSTGIYLSSDFMATIKDTIITSSGGDGIYLSDTGIVDIQGVTITSSGTGIDISGGGNVSIQNAIITSDGDCINLSSNSEVVIYDGDFTTSNSRNKCLNVSRSASVIVYAGMFTAPDDCVYNSGTVTFYTGTFTATDDNDGCLYSSGGKWIIADGYTADPDNWQNSPASVVTFYPITVNVRFYSENKLVEEQTDMIKNLHFPDAPVSSLGYDFLYWETEDGTPVTDLSQIKSDTDLYAVFSDRTYTVTFIDNEQQTEITVKPGTPLGKVSGLERKESGDNFRFWKCGNEVVSETTEMPVYSNLTLIAVYSGVVMNYEELQAAIQAKDPIIVLGADILCTGTVKIAYDCILDGNGFGLIRPESFLDVLLSVENGVSGGETDPDVETDKTTLTVRNVRIDGSNIEAHDSAVSAGEGTTLNMKNVTVENNISIYGYVAADKASYDGIGGGIYLENANAVLQDCIIRNNDAGRNGGGIYAAVYQSDNTYCLDMTGCSILGNKADDEGGGIYVDDDIQVKLINCKISGNQSDDGGGLLCGTNNSSLPAVIKDTTVSDNTARNEGGGIFIKQTIIHLYGNSLIANNMASNGGGIYSSWGDSDNCIVYMHDNSNISYNEADNGGGVYCSELKLVMYDDSVISHNTAIENGGGVYAGDYGIYQEGGVIRDNSAGKKGGGVYVTYSSSFRTGMVFDNTAGKAGDDLYFYRGLKKLYTTQPTRINGEGNSATLGTVSVDLLPDYEPIPLDEISVPWYGWFVDGEDFSGNVLGDDGKYHYVEDIRDRYTEIETSKRVCSENGNLNILSGGTEDIGVKAIWSGVFLVYDANYAGSTDFRYDLNVYERGTNATVKGKIFSRPGYRFVGWNTEKDGSGASYKEGDALLMDKSKVLYAQWEIEQYFNVVHVSEKGENVSEPEQIEITEDIRENGYSLTDIVPDGYLYGGAFTDEGCQTVYPFADGENGKSFNPEAGETYYIWEVNEKYLAPKTFCVWLHTGEGNNKDVIELYFLTPLDRLLYREAGFTMSGNDYASEKDGENLAYGVIKPTYVRRQDRTDLLYLDNGEMKQKTFYDESDTFAKDEGYIGAYKLTDEQFADFKENGCTFQPYWITLDGVKVTGVNERACSYNGVGEDTQNEMITVNNNRLGSVCTAVNTSSNDIMQFADAYTIIADPEVTEPVIPVEPVEPVDPVEPPIENDVTITVNDNGEVYEISANIGDSLNISYAGVNGKLFAGWFTDDRYETSADLNSVQENMTIYAKYVDDAFLRFKFVQQRLFGTDIYMFSAIDSTDYAEVGFVVNGETIPADHIGSKYSVYSARTLFGSGVGKNAKLVVGSSSTRGMSYGDTITIVPYWVTLDGTMVYGTERTLTYERYGLR